jgi:hypothetical protein
MFESRGVTIFVSRLILVGMTDEEKRRRGRPQVVDKATHRMVTIWLPDEDADWLTSIRGGGSQWLRSVVRRARMRAERYGVRDGE